MVLLDAARPCGLCLALRFSSRAIFVGVLLILTTLFTIEAVAQAPTVPTGLRASSGDGQVTLSWTAPSPVVDSNITYDYIHNGISNWLPIGSGTSGIVPELDNGIQYAFKVRAARGNDKGTESRTVTVRPLRSAPGAPGSLQVERVEGTAILTWSPPSNRGDDIIRYEYSSDGGSTWKSTGSSSATYTVTGLKIGEEYTFHLKNYLTKIKIPDIINTVKLNNSVNSWIET